MKFGMSYINLDLRVTQFAADEINLSLVGLHFGIEICLTVKQTLVLLVILFTLFAAVLNCGESFVRLFG